MSTPDDLSLMTYLSYYRDYVNNAEKELEERRKQEELRRRNTADPSHTHAHGPGVQEEGVFAHVPAHFVIQAANFFGEPLQTGGELFAVEVVGKEATTAAAVTDKGNGTYSVAYLPTVPDNYNVNVTLRGEHIKGSPSPFFQFFVLIFSLVYIGSPYHVHIEGAQPHTTIAHGPGLTQGGAHTNKPATFTIHARDSKSRPLSHGGDTFGVRIIREADGVPVPAEVADNSDGTYAVSYRPTSSGAHRAEVTLRGVPISGAPYSTIVYGMYLIPSTCSSTFNCIFSGYSREIVCRGTRSVRF